MSRLGRNFVAVSVGLVFAEALILFFLQPLTLVTTDLVAFYGTGSILRGTLVVLGIGVLLALGVVAIGARAFRPAPDPDCGDDLLERAIRHNQFARALATLGAAACLLGVAAVVLSFGYLAIEDADLPPRLHGGAILTVIVLMVGPVVIFVSGILYISSPRSSPKVASGVPETTESCQDGIRASQPSKADQAER
jgi:hypothetical protein